MLRAALRGRGERGVPELVAQHPRPQTLPAAKTPTPITFALGSVSA